MPLRLLAPLILTGLATVGRRTDGRDARSSFRRRRRAGRRNRSFGGGNQSSWLRNVSCRETGRPAAYRAEADYIADKCGRVDLASAVPVAGDYKGSDAAGLFWSMRPLAAVLTDVAPGSARVTVLIAGKATTNAVTRFTVDRPGIGSEPIVGFPGAMLYRPSSSRRRLPVVIALGGSEGGTSFGRTFAPWLASHGYAVIALPYYAPDWGSEKLPGLPVGLCRPYPSTGLRQCIAGSRGGPISIDGISDCTASRRAANSRSSRRHAFLGLRLSPPSYRRTWYGRAGARTSRRTTCDRPSLGGNAACYVPYSGMRETITALYRGERRSLRVPHERGRASNPMRVAAARIPIERYRGALLVAGGGKDETWPSGTMATNIGLTRARAGLKTQVLTFPEAGHGLSGGGWDPENTRSLRPAQRPLLMRRSQFKRRHLRFLGKRCDSVPKCQNRTVVTPVRRSASLRCRS